MDPQMHPKPKSDYHRTPNLDSMLDKGMRFSNGYASAPVCAPSRYGIQFGKTPARLRLPVGRPNHAYHNQTGIPQLLKKINPTT